MFWEKLGFSREKELEGGRVDGEEEVEYDNVPENPNGDDSGFGYTSTATNEDVNTENPANLEKADSSGNRSFLKAILGGSEEQIDAPDAASMTIPKKEPRMAGNMLMRVNGIFVVMIATCQTFAGLQTYLFKDNADVSFHFVGAFWVGLILLLPGILGVMSTSYTIVMWGFISSVISFIFAILGVVSDGSAYTTYMQIKACSHYTNTTVTDGEIGNYSDAGNTNGCFSNNNQYDCSCIDTSYNCYVFDGGSLSNALENNCNTIIEDYPDYLVSSYGICIVCVAVIFVYMIFSGCSLFCPSYLEKDYVWFVEEKEPKLEEKQEEMIKEVTTFYESPAKRR